MENNQGTFTISLDFELFWGVRDKRELEDYKKNLYGVWDVIPKMLELFREYEIHTTWATVGFLFFKDFDDLYKNIPEITPQYKNIKLSQYDYIIGQGKENSSLQVHFTKELIALIRDTPNQEIASHTFSHFYTMEENSEEKSFEYDIKAYTILAETENIDLKSIVFPRNQISKESLNVLKGSSINVYRGNPLHWAYKDGDVKKTFFTKVVRFLDTYFNVTGHKSSKPILNNDMFNVQASMFLRPYTKKFALLESLKIKRIKNAMLYAAQNGENFHLWWHPHNFGINQNENLKNLKIILEYYKVLEKEYNMKSKTMKELVYG